LLQNVVDKLFILALVAITLGVLSYLGTFVLSRIAPPRSSNVTLLDASLDPKDSPYQQTVKGRRKIITPKKQSVNKGDDADDKH